MDRYVKYTHIIMIHIHFSVIEISRESNQVSAAMTTPPVYLWHTHRYARTRYIEKACSRYTTLVLGVYDM
jgi:hypothetical protein